MKSAHGHITSALLLLAIFQSPAAFAGMYKWVDENGEVHYSDRVPPKAVKQERKAINEQGRTVKVYERAKTEEELEEARRQRKIELEKKKQAEEEALKDRVLLATYSNEEDMIETRDGKLASIDGLIQLTERRIESMQERLGELTEDAASYERSGKPVPEVLTQQIENIRKQTSENKEFILVKLDERKAIEEKFSEDIARFRKLKQDEK